MRVALINPRWSFEGSIYFGCRHPHLASEFGTTRQLLEADGHTVLLLDAHMFDLSHADVRAELAAFRPEMTVITTAPTYLFWRCAQPELRICQELVSAIRDLSPRMVAVGPHGSSTPRTALRKLGVDMVIMGECEEPLAELAGGSEEVSGSCFWQGQEIAVRGGPRAACFVDTPPLVWPTEMIRRHRHHHHRFDAEPDAPGAEVEASRGCPYSCSFCAKTHFRDAYRRRPVDAVLREIDGLVAQGVDYIYFVDEIFLPNAELLAGMAERDVRFGVQTRIDLWTPDMIRALGRAGCVSIEAGVESLTVEGRAALNKKCRLSTDELAERLLVAGDNVPFVQANLIEMPDDDEETVAAWRRRMRDAGIWANDPVPMFPYPSSPAYRSLWGECDDHAWERAVDYYLDSFCTMSDLQDDRPLRLDELEATAP